MLHNLVGMFKRVGLFLQILNEPIRKGVNLEKIFQIDIKGENKNNHRNEKFRIYPGTNPEIRINVINTDQEKKQLILQVKEPEVTFKQIYQLGYKERIDKYMNDPTARIIDNKTVELTQTTSAEDRTFLMGVDERQLFITQLRQKCRTVDEAHHFLKRNVIRFANNRSAIGTSRQGEWFFIETNQSIRDDIEMKIKRTEAFIKHKQNIGDILGRSGGNPHIADEIAILPRIDDHKSIESKNRSRIVSPHFRHRVFVKGNVRHKDHKTVHFRNWREVIINNENSLRNQSRITAAGVYWFD